MKELVVLLEAETKLGEVFVVDTQSPLTGVVLQRLHWDRTVLGSFQDSESGSRDEIESRNIERFIERWEKVSAMSLEEGSVGDNAGIKYITSLEEEVPLSERGDLHLLRAPNWQERGTRSLAVVSQVGISFGEGDLGMHISAVVVQKWTENVGLSGNMTQEKEVNQLYGEV